MVGVATLTALWKRPNRKAVRTCSTANDDILECAHWRLAQTHLFPFTDSRAPSRQQPAKCPFQKGQKSSKFLKNQKKTWHPNPVRRISEVGQSARFFLKNVQKLSSETLFPFCACRGEGSNGAHVFKTANFAASHASKF